ncbi:MAG: pyridoxal phosphate-dependent aminotransferase [Candidatus Omnitrophica bacterium]|nr:pyridoxal phosphate-dependent aminotransferase [Candidatus Omnitrophota bacterium]MDD5672006.1 pyridoxal phosphate-dependent aminotransferase [Candidatus Omnitrophota bacterium]
MTKILKLKSPADFIGKQGPGVISFGSGQPDLPPPKETFEGVDLTRDLRYGLIQGEIKLREKLAHEYPGSTAENFVITNGASEALDLIFRSWGKGQKVLLPRPYYYSYLPIIQMAGMVPVFTDLIDGRIDIEDFKKKIGKCKAVLINSPSNPTGRVEAIETLKTIEKVTQKLGVYVVSDEVYKDLIYERENYHIHGNHVITVNSFSKTYCMCGVRVGYLWSSDKSVVEGVCEMKTHTSMNTNLVGQDMALSAMKAPKEYIHRQQKIWRQRRDYIYEGLLNLGFDLWKPEGAFYVLPKCKNARKFLSLLYQDYQVITYLGEWFGAPDRIRLSYALDIKQIEEGLGRIQEAMKKVNVL